MFVNISAYCFVALDDTMQLREAILSCCQAHGLKGTVLLSTNDGINLNLCGSRESIEAFKILYRLIVVSKTWNLKKAFLT